MQIQISDLIQPINLTGIIVAGISALTSVYSLRKQREVREPEPPKRREEKPVRRKINVWKITTGVSSTLFVGAIVLLFVRFNAPTKVEITYPDDWAPADMREMVRGTSQKVPKGQTIWVVSYPHVTGRYYPQNDPAYVEANGDWSALTSIGIEEDSGLKFDIIVVLANQSAQEKFRDYLLTAKGEKEWPGLESLPDGVTIYNHVMVIRK